MRLDQMDITTVVVEDLRVVLRVSWPEFRKLTSSTRKMAQKLPDDPEAIANMSAEERAKLLEDGEDTFGEMTRLLKKHIVGVEGITEVGPDGQEKPVPWKPELIDKFSPRLVMAVYRAIVNPSAAKQANDGPLS